VAAAARAFRVELVPEVVGGFGASARRKRTAEKRGPPPSAPAAPSYDGAAGS